jgi:hypothetical protein
MTQIKSQLLLASKNVATKTTLFTFVWTYPRIILPEINTHRVLSRNTSSTRAIPSKKQRARVWEDPFVPVHIGANQKGMQAGEELEGWRRAAAEWIWKTARLPQLGAAWAMERLGVHKQIANRLLEPWVWVQQLISATEWSNLIHQRDHHMAEPHFHELAAQAHQQISAASEFFKFMEDSHTNLLYNCKQGHQNSREPMYNLLRPREWHLPFIDRHELSLPLDTQIKVSSARCARVSYLLPENGERSSIERDLELYNRLASRPEGSSDPLHLSPLEHPATAMSTGEFYGNFRGFKQHRKFISNESGECYTLS